MLRNPAGGTHGRLRLAIRTHLVDVMQVVCGAKDLHAAAGVWTNAGVVLALLLLFRDCVLAKEVRNISQRRHSGAVVGRVEEVWMCRSIPDPVPTMAAFAGTARR